MEHNQTDILCENPIPIRPKYKADHKGFEHLNRISESDFILVPCGKCKVCTYKFAKEWAHRIELEMEYYGGADNCAFITLTYDDDHLPWDHSVHKHHVQKFVKRVRMRLKQRDIKYYAVGEYGEKKQRAHYHLIMMGVDGKDHHNQMMRLKTGQKLIPTKDDWWHIHHSWDNGFLDIQRPKSTGSAGGYVANYLNKMDKAKKDALRLGLDPPFRIMSKCLGLRQVLKMAEKYKDNDDTQWPINYIERGKYKKPLGRFLREKLHEASGKMSVLIAHNQIYIKKAFYRYSHLGVGVMDTGALDDMKLQARKRVLVNRIKWKLGET